MLFNSVVFLYLFLPATLLAYFIFPKALRNHLLAIASISFFAWGGVNYTLLLLVSTLINYVFGLLAEDDRKRGKLWLILGVFANLGILFYFKYSGFFMENYNQLAKGLGWQISEFKAVILPIGISFYTFHGMSYQIDVYRDVSKAQRKFMDLLLYKTFFPQLIAGPIIRYNTIAEQIKKREFLWSNVQEGLERFIIGLAKKVIIANTFAYVADALWTINIS
ncbi:MAG: MBOAT family O-acyltransferase, partial [Bacteroidia bacterium]|nr:MBOAT family O-acyltransferase [Bacteroidia bacterium]